jgi:3-methyladenine DNA glycosylase AlkD
MSAARRSATTERVRALLDERLPGARGLGAALAQLIDDPEQFVVVARQGLAALADDAYRAEVARVAPGPVPTFGVRAPLLAALERQLRVPLADSSPASALWLAQRLTEEDEREFTLLGQRALARTLPDDPERSWQLIRRLARAASDWIAVDSLAELVARGILFEPYRWAEVEQLIYSDDPWERRLVASTIATLPHLLPRHRRQQLAGDATPTLMLIESMIGDDDPSVQKALSWALRSWHGVEAQRVEEFISREAARAAASHDGFRAWVLRDALTAPAMPALLVSAVRRQLIGVRRGTDRQPSSRARQIAQDFAAVEDLADRAIAEKGQRQRRARGSPAGVSR